MAREEVDEGLFWLPSEFLTDEDLLTDFRMQGFGGGGFGFSSPVESVTGSVETESDEDEFVSGLTWNMARTSLRGCGFSSEFAAEGLKMYGSPQSTLCGCDSGVGWLCPSCRFFRAAEAKPAVNWDLLYAAAEEVARLRMAHAKTTPFHSAAFAVRPPFYPYRSRAEAAHLAFLHLRAAQATKHHPPATKSGAVHLQTQPDARTRFPPLPGANSDDAWPTLQQSVNLRRHPVFLGDNAPLNKERNGTGVFLPRRFGHNSNPTAESRKKPAAPAVLRDEAVALRNNYDNNGRVATAAAAAGELKLPHEWAY